MPGSPEVAGLGALAFIWLGVQKSLKSKQTAVPGLLSCLLRSSLSLVGSRPFTHGPSSIFLPVPGIIQVMCLVPLLLPVRWQLLLRFAMSAHLFCPVGFFLLCPGWLGLVAALRLFACGLWLAWLGGTPSPDPGGRQTCCAFRVPFFLPHVSLACALFVLCLYMCVHS